MLVAGEPIDKNTILSIPCDVLVPAAIEGVINADTAGQVDAKYVVEAANGPTTPEGDKILRERDIIVLPDIYTNGGTLSPLSCLRLREVYLAGLPGLSLLALQGRHIGCAWQTLFVIVRHNMIVFWPMVVACKSKVLCTLCMDMEMHCLQMCSASCQPTRACLRAKALHQKVLVHTMFKTVHIAHAVRSMFTGKVDLVVQAV